MRRRPAESTAAKGGRDDTGKAERQSPQFEKPRFEKTDATKSAKPALSKASIGDCICAASSSRTS